MRNLNLHQRLIHRHRKNVSYYLVEKVMITIMVNLRLQVIV